MSILLSTWPFPGIMNSCVSSVPCTAALFYLVNLFFLSASSHLRLSYWIMH